MLAPPDEVYPSPWTGPLPDLRDCLSLNPELADATPETVAERLGCDAWLVESALEALTVEGEVLG